MTEVTGRIDVFISYKREERRQSERVKRAMINAGYTAVTDLNIGKNEEFGDAIDTMIRTATLTLVLWTKASVTSDWVRKEARLARDLEKAGKRNRYLGVMVEDVDLDLPPDLRGLQMVDLHDVGLDETGLAELLGAAHDILGPEVQKNSQSAESDSVALTEEWQLYEVARSINVAASYNRYLARYPNGEFADDARRQLRMFIWYLHPIRRGNVSHTLAALGIFATVAVTIWAASRDPIVVGVAAAEHRQKVLALDEATSLARDLETQLDAAETTQENLQAEVETLSSRSDVALARVSELENERSELLDERTRLAEALQAAQAEVETLSSRSDAALARVSELENERSELLDERTRLAEALQAAEAEVAAVLISPKRSDGGNRDAARCTYATLGALCVPASDPSRGAIPCSEELLGSYCIRQ